VRADAGYLRLAGKDRRDFLNRQSTNDVSLLRPERSVTTVLTSPTARIEDVLVLIDEGDAIGTLTLEGRQARTANALQSKIFFMDQVTAVDVSDEVEQVDLFGPEATNVLAGLGTEVSPEQNAVATIDFAGSTVVIVAQAGMLSPGFRLVYPRSISAAVRTEFERRGALQLGDGTYETLRVEAGLPGPQHELTDSYTPLEAGLGAAISTSKGCYTGQEIIARQINYDKVTKRLAGLRLSAEIDPATPLKVEDKQAGISASAALSPRFGPIAFAYLKRPFDAPGVQVYGLDASGASFSATVVDLPFAG